MIDETDISQERKWFYEQRARTVVNNLQKRNMNGQYVSSRQEALSAILEMIPPGAIVARGDSVSFDQVGVIPELMKRNQNTLIDPFQRDANGFYVAEAEERRRMQRETFFADIFLTGTNAITPDGKLVSTDGLGNRTKWVPGEILDFNLSGCSKGVNALLTASSSNFDAKQEAGSG